VNSEETIAKRQPDQVETRLALVIETRLKEYDTLRDEVLQSITHRTQIISFGFGGIATFTTGTLLVALPKKEPTLALAVFSVVIPIMSAVFLLLWFSELMRMFRASNHLFGLEQRVNQDLGTQALTWETELAQDGNRGLRMVYLLVIGFFLALGMFAPFVGVAVTEPAGWRDPLTYLPALVGLFLGWGLIARANRERRALKTVRESVYAAANT